MRQRGEAGGSGRVHIGRVGKCMEEEEGLVKGKRSVGMEMEKRRIRIK